MKSVLMSKDTKEAEYIRRYEGKDYIGNTKDARGDKPQRIILIGDKRIIET